MLEAATTPAMTVIYARAHYERAMAVRAAWNWLFGRKV